MEVLPPPTTAAQALESSKKRTRELFGSEYGQLSALEPTIGTSYRRKAEYEDVRELPRALAEKTSQSYSSRTSEETESPERSRSRE